MFLRRSHDATLCFMVEFLGMKLFHFSAHTIALGLMMGLVVCLSVYHLQDSPRTWFDEGIYLSLAKNVAQHGVYGMFSTPSTIIPTDAITVGYPVIFPLAALLYIFGSSMLVARLFAITWIFALLVVVYRYVSEKVNAKAGLLSIAFLAVFSPLYGNGKNVLGEVPGLVFVFVSVWAYERLCTSSRLRYAVISGSAAALAAATKPIFLPFLAFFGLYTVIAWYRRAITWQQFGSMWGSGVLFFGLWIVTQFSRATDVAFVWAHYTNPYNVSDPWSHALSNAWLFVTDFSPAHVLFVFILSIISLWMYRRKLGTLAPLFLFATLVLVNFLKSPPWYRYFFVAHVILIVVSSVVWEYVITRFRYRQVGIGVLSVFVGLQLYYTVTHIDRMFYPPWREVRAIIEQSSGGIFFVNVPEGEFFARTRDYAQYLKIREGLVYGAEYLPLLGEYSLIVTRDGVEDVAFVRGMLPSYRERHIGNYFIFEK